MEAERCLDHFAMVLIVNVVDLEEVGHLPMEEDSKTLAAGDLYEEAHPIRDEKGCLLLHGHYEEEAHEEAHEEAVQAAHPFLTENETTVM